MPGMSRIARLRLVLATTVTAGALLAGCGQPGPLYLPKPPAAKGAPAKGPVEPAPVPPPPVIVPVT